MPSYLNDLGLICALGHDKHSVARALFDGDAGGMQAQTGWLHECTAMVGAVTAPLPAMPLGLESAHSRNNQLLLAAALPIEPSIRAAIARFGHERIAVVIGTSTSGIDEASQDIAHMVDHGALPSSYRYAQQEMVAPARFLSDWLELSGPSYSLSTACTSSARALLSAQRLLQLGVCDAVLCGGVDSLCGLTLNGFAALEALSAERCMPFSANRNGINIGEAAALFLLTQTPLSANSTIALLGAGASSDAYHISAPQPDGLGAQQAMTKALASAQLDAEQIDYLNLHGTATQHNDAMESLAVHALFPHGVACSSSKPLTGHTLGAAGALEAAFCWLTLSTYNSSNRLPPHLWDGVADPALPALNLTSHGSQLRAGDSRRLMSNSFAFGGNNVALIVGDAP